MIRKIKFPLTNWDKHRVCKCSTICMYCPLVVTGFAPLVMKEQLGCSEAPGEQLGVQRLAQRHFGMREGIKAPLPTELQTTRLLWTSQMFLQGKINKMCENAEIINNMTLRP